MKIVGHQKQIAYINQLIHAHKLPHGLLLTGPQGIGKKLFAYHLAQTLFCEDKQNAPCGNCSHCLRISENKHPDFTFIQPENHTIKVEFIRDLKQKLSLQALESEYKIAIIDDADTLHPSAANVLLKTLEEPPPQTLIILISPSPHKLLKTILSRCQKITFSPLSHAEMKEVPALKESNSLSNEKLDLSQGSPGQFLKFSEEAFEIVENEIIPSLESQPKDLMKLLQISENLSKEEELSESVLNLLLLKWGKNIPQHPQLNYALKTKALYEAGRKLRETHANPQLTFENLFLKLCL